MKQSTCSHCKEIFDLVGKPAGWMANHSRWCKENPKRNTYNKNLDKARSAKTNFKNHYSYGAKISDETRAKISSSNKGRRHTEDTKRRISEKALASNHRRLKKGVVEYKGVMLDSSWELALAKRLDELEISWTRPAPIKWTSADGISHNYFPDFYLPDYDLYIDPKNPHAKRVQKSKLDVLLLQHTNILIIESLEECENFAIQGPP